MTDDDQLTRARYRLALELPLLFHSGGAWDEGKRQRWEGIILMLDPATRSTEATTAVLCATLRAVLAQEARP